MSLPSEPLNIHKARSGSCLCQVWPWQVIQRQVSPVPCQFPWVTDRKKNCGGTMCHLEPPGNPIFTVPAASMGGPTSRVQQVGALQATNSMVISLHMCMSWLSNYMYLWCFKAVKGNPVSMKFSSWKHTKLAMFEEAGGYRVWLSLPSGQ